MRMNMIHAVAFTVTALSLLSTSAFAATVSSAAQAASQVTSAPQVCPAGTYWEPSGYVSSGRWRDDHCAANDGRQ